MQHNSTFVDRQPMSAVLARQPRQRSAWEIQRAVLFAIVLRELRTRMGRHWTGILWTVFEPLAHVLVLLTVFGYLKNIASPVMEYPVFLISGLMPFFLFRSLSQRLTESIESNRGLFSYRQVKPLDTVVGRAIVESVIWIAVLVFTLAILLWLGLHALPRRPLEFFGVAVVTALLGCALGLLMAVTTQGQRRLRFVIRMLYVPLYISSGVIWNVNKLPPGWFDWLTWNPMMHLVDLARNAFEPLHQVHAGLGWRYPVSATLVLMAAAFAMYRRDRQKLLMER
ncbi:MAG TPA: ABC transporter permease [Burkholderiaceae bacterium]|nr:ABC transporter permease [Burkholderiaceae bacterium]